MKRKTYFLKALAAGAYRHRDWVFRGFSVSNVGDLPENSYPYQLYAKDGQYWFLDPENEYTPTPIDNSNIYEPLFYKLAKITINPTTVPNATKEIVTTYGNVLFNYYCLIYPFGNKFDFVTGKISISKIEKMLIPHIVDDVPESEMQEGVLYVKRLIAYLDAAFMLSAYSVIFSPTATRYTMTPAPEAIAYLNKDYAENKEKYEDPLYVAEVGRKIEELDRKYVDQDPNKGFYQAAKQFSIIRKNIHYFKGYEYNLDGSGGKFIRNSLEMGWDINDLPELANTVRDGSINRGLLTALAGVQVKNVFRMMTGAEASVEECGATMGIPFKLPLHRLEKFIGSYIIVDEKTVELTSENVSQYANKSILLRHSGYCRNTRNHYCVHCLGSFVRGREKSLNTIAADAPSVMLAVFMSAMHGTTPVIVDYDLALAFS